MVLPVRQRYLWILIAASLTLGAAWADVIPPFEGPDESAYYNALMNRAHTKSGAGQEPLYGALMAPILRLAGGRGGRPVQTHYNPSFRFVGNQAGRVNVYLHGRAEGMAKGDVNRMYLLRAIALVMWTASLGFVFVAARAFFGRDDLALLTAALCLALPQWSFFSTKIHQEVTCGLLGAVAYAAFALRAAGRLPRVALWLIALPVLLLAPFSDRQGYFLLLLVPFGLVVTETTLATAAAAAGALLVPAIALMALPMFAPLRSDIAVTAFSILSPSYHGGFWNPDNPQYFAYEFTPKMFFGFIGWLGQPSILLPPPVYAAAAAAMVLAAIGLFVRDSGEPMTPAQRKMALLFTAGVLFTLLPIVYANIIITRNSWHGRWLFPSIAPIMIALVFGFRRFAAHAARRPHATALAVVAASVLLGIAWTATPLGELLRDGIRRNHYGDQAHLRRTVLDMILALGMAGAAIEIVALAGRPAASLFRRAWPLGVVALPWALNLTLLFAFVAPLYRPLEAEGFAAQVRQEIAEGEWGRAAGLYRVATGVYPESTALRRIAADSPLILLSGGDEHLVAELQTRLAHGELLATRAELMALARIDGTRGWNEPAALERVLQQPTGGDPALAEPLALMRTELAGRLGDADAGRRIIEAGGGVYRPKDLRGEMLVEGFTMHGEPGATELTMYFRPIKPWRGRRIAVHAYPPESDDYISVEPSPPAFADWRAGELAWETFHVPSRVRYNSYLVGENIDPGYPIGLIGP